MCIQLAAQLTKLTVQSTQQTTQLEKLTAAFTNRNPPKTRKTPKNTTSTKITNGPRVPALHLLGKLEPKALHNAWAGLV
jgi:hypothetical protein